MLDLFNHGDKCKNVVRRGDGIVHKRTEYIFEVKQYTRGGSQVFASYGDLSPMQQLLGFGFCDRTGPASQIGVTAFRVLPNSWVTDGDAIDVELSVNLRKPDTEDMEHQLHGVWELRHISNA
jgi:hypothetical protein